MSIIAADIGGTKCWLAHLQGSSVESSHLGFETRYQSKDFDSISALLKRFTEEASLTPGSVTHLILALPGPVSENRCQLTNLDWLVNAETLSSELSIPHVMLLNDFQAASAGVATLNPDELIPLNQAEAHPQGRRVVTGAGTGLGLAWMEWQEEGYQYRASEGGHMNFFPCGELQLELLRYLSQIKGESYISCEQLLSGHGLETIYRFICVRNGMTEEGLADGLDAATISTRANKREPLATEALGLFVEIYGSWVGNLALLYRPTGGIFIAGGIAAKLVSSIRSERFINACYNKGGMTGLVQDTPIYLITNERLGLQGAIATATQYDRK